MSESEFDALVSSLPLKEARSSIGADHGSGLTGPLLHPPPPWMPLPWPATAIHRGEPGGGISLGGVDFWSLLG